jgi:hypothetical protein
MFNPPSSLQEAKWWLVHHTGLAKDALHIYVALTLLFGSALLFGWKLSSWRPWAVVAVAALVGEAWDLRDSIVYHTRIDLWANWHDVWNTLFWPTAIMLIARRTRLFGR